MRTIGIAVALVVWSACGRIGFNALEADSGFDALEADSGFNAIEADAASCNVVIEAAMDTMPANWMFNGSAIIDSATSSAMLTDATPTGGSILYATRMNLDAFDATFDFNIGGGDRGDGMGFVLERDGSTALGYGGGGIGIAGLAGFGVELDTHQNTTCSGNPDNNHVGIDNLMTCGTMPQDLVPTTLAVAPVTGFDLQDGAWHRCEIHFAAGSISVSLDGQRYIDGFAITGWNAGDSYFFGFAAANGGTVDRHSVKNVKLTVIRPCP